jgi:hypothetical protein
MKGRYIEEEDILFYPAIMEYVTVVNKNPDGTLDVAYDPEDSEDNTQYLYGIYPEDLQFPEP